MHTSMCYTRQCVVYTTDTSYEIRGLQTPRVLYTTDAMYERPCATHVRVLCTLLIQATHVRRRPCVGQSCEPLIPATSPSVVFTTVTSYTRPRNFLVHFFYYIRDLHILHASFSTCASDLNKTDGLRELARD